MKPTLQLKTAYFLLISIITYNKIFSQAGTLDKNFGDTGVTITSFKNADAFAASVKIQSTGNIVVGGYAITSSSAFAITRYNKNGILDSTFGLFGYFNPTISNSDYCRAIAIQKDDKILAAGSSYNSSSENFILSRLKSNGFFDSSFGSNGITLTSFGLGSSEAACMAIQTDEKILLAGDAYNTSTSEIAMARYNKDGKLDSSFGANGKVLTDIIGNTDAANAIAIQPDGKIVVACVSFISDFSRDITLVRYNANGTVDSNFGTKGQVAIDFNNGDDIPHALAIQNNGKIVVAGGTRTSAYRKYALAQLNANGNLDSSFGINGKVTTSIGTGINQSDEIWSMVLESDNKIIAGGVSNNYNNFNNFSIARYNINGLLDNDFGNKGSTITQAGNTIYNLTLQIDEKILAAGFGSDGKHPSFAIARYNNDDNILPISLLSFTATKQQQFVLLNWQTANEINNSYFSVERSNDNKNFSEINKLYSTNNLSKINAYNATDLQPLKGWNYYRLKQVDKDGRFTYSSIAAVLFNSETLISIYPNPANNFMYIDGLKEGIQSTIIITDVNGKTLLTSVINQSSNKINIQNLASGVYYINIIQNGKSFKQKFVKQ